jgi:ABC-2 type transport system ATP-binding protein
MLEARELSKSYASVPAVKDVTFSLSPGQVLGCLGPNGSGKSTTVKMLTGLLEPTRGKVLFDGQNIQEDLVGFRKCLGYVPEGPNLYPYLSGREYLELVGTLRGMPRSSLERKIDTLLDLFSLHSHRHSSIASYSKEMRQRILLIAARMDDPKLLIFDEPLFAAGVAAVVLVLLGGTTWLSGGFWAPDGVYSRFVSPAIGLVWGMVASGVLLTRSPTSRAGW